MGSLSGSGRSPGVGNGNPLQDSCLKNSMDRGAWWATVLGVSKSWTQHNKLAWAAKCATALGVSCYRINRKLIHRVFKWCKDFPGLIPSYPGEVTEWKMGKDSYNQPLWVGYRLDSSTPPAWENIWNFPCLRELRRGWEGLADWWNPTVMKGENMSKYSMEPQRWGPGTGSEVNTGDQFAKPKLALMEARGWPQARYFLLLSCPEAGPACQNLGEKEGVSKNT